MSQVRAEVCWRCPRCTLLIRPRFAINSPKTCPRCLALAHVHVKLQRVSGQRILTTRRSLGLR